MSLLGRSTAGALDTTQFAWLAASRHVVILIRRLYAARRWPGWPSIRFLENAQESPK